MENILVVSLFFLTAAGELAHEALLLNKGFQAVLKARPLDFTFALL